MSVSSAKKNTVESRSNVNAFKRLRRVFGTKRRYDSADRDWEAARREALTRCGMLSLY